MADLLCAMVYFGGIGPAYFRERRLGRGSISAMGSAILWPFGLGLYIGIHFYRCLDETQ